MDTKNVVAAVIIHNERVFATQRGYGEFKDKWEFPGGKVQPGETRQEALIREIREELNTTISVGEMIDTIETDYPNFHLSMSCYFCTVLEGKLSLLEHEAAKWLNKKHLYDVDWLPADRAILKEVEKKLN